MHDRVIHRIRARFREAARGASGPEQALEQMGATYPELISDRFALLGQLQCYAASGDPEIRRHVAREFKALADEIRELSGASRKQVGEFLAAGMLANVTTLLGLPEICDPLWEQEPAARSSRTR